MSVVCEVIVEDPRWGSTIQALCDTGVTRCLAHLGLSADDFLVSVLACDDQKISILNKDFRGKAKATNVLSWPSEERVPDELPDPGSLDDPEELGDIAIAFDTCAREAREAKITFEDHVVHLIIHATLHLLGYDHEEDDEAELMESTETAILASLGIADPYR